MKIPAEILAAIIGSIFTAIVGIIAWQYKTHKGNKVILRKVNETSAIRLSDKVRENLSITYKGKEVKRLIVYEFNIYNNGDKDITNLDISIQIPLETLLSKPLIEPIVSDHQEKTEMSVDISLRGYFIFKLKRPFLNTRKKYKDEVIYLQIISDSELNLGISGGGEGWSTEYFDVEKRDKKLFKLGISFLIIGASAAILTVIFDKYNYYLILTALMIGLFGDGLSTYAKRNQYNKR